MKKPIIAALVVLYSAVGVAQTSPLPPLQPPLQPPVSTAPYRTPQPLPSSPTLGTMPAPAPSPAPVFLPPPDRRAATDRKGEGFATPSHTREGVTPSEANASRHTGKRAKRHAMKQHDEAVTKKSGKKKSGHGHVGKKVKKSSVDKAANKAAMHRRAASKHPQRTTPAVDQRNDGSSP